MEFSCTTRELGDQLVVEVHGAVDLATAPRLRLQLVDAVSGGRTVLILDLRGVDFIDSTGLGVLVSVWKRVRAAGGCFHVVATHDAVTKPLWVTGLHKVFNVCASVDAATSTAV